MGQGKWSFDYKKEYKDLYMPKRSPSIVKVPLMNYIAVCGKGSPDAEGGEYKDSVRLLYVIAFTIKMSKKYDHQIAGYFDYVIPPQESLWMRENDYSRQEDFHFISMIRLPYFVTKEDIDWAREAVARKKRSDFSKVEFFTYNEGLCVQCMHLVSYENKQETIHSMHDFMTAQGYKLDITDTRFHHEIYLSNPGRVAAEKRKTVIRHPII